MEKTMTLDYQYHDGGDQLLIDGKEAEALNKDDINVVVKFKHNNRYGLINPKKTEVYKK